MAGNPLMNHASRFEWNGYSAQERAGADECARYLAAKACYLGYPKALKEGWPIATGIIEGACRHIVKDRT